MPFAVESEMLKTKTSTTAMRESTLAVGRVGPPVNESLAPYLLETRAFND